MRPIDPLQSRMARAALGLTLRDLSKLSHIPLYVLSRFENGKALTPERDATLRFVLEQSGVCFVDDDPFDGAGVRMRKSFLNRMLFDGEGTQVAQVLGETVVDVLNGDRIGVMQGDHVLALDGFAVGSLQVCDVSRGVGSLSDAKLNTLRHAAIGRNTPIRIVDAEGRTPVGGSQGGGNAVVDPPS